MFMGLEKLNRWPSPQATRRTRIIALIMTCVMYVVLGYFFFLSGDPVFVLTSQLSFSGAFMVQEFSQVTNLDAYRIAQILDYGLMVSYALLIFALALTIARKVDEKSPLRKAGLIIALLGFVVAGCDVVENIFILLMVTAPMTFPAWWAVAHSSFALPKWIILMVAIGWAVAAEITQRSQRTGKPV